MDGPFAISEHLNMVEVICNVVDERILKVLKFLTAYNIRKLTNNTSLALYYSEIRFHI